jgi:hypothetical protein
MIASVGGLPPVVAGLLEMGLVTDGVLEFRLEVGDGKVELVKIMYEMVSGVC